MVKAVGIDPGTMSMDVFGFDDETGEILIDVSVPREKVTENPGIIVEILEKVDRERGGIDAIVGPSGYGVPLKRASETEDWEILLATFVSKNDAQRRLRIMGLRDLMFRLKRSKLNVWFSPGVVHLPTVPRYRKANRIDLGTADKVFTAVIAVKDHAEYYSVPYSEARLIVVEVGFAYTAALAIDGGKIVDGVGGTSGWPGYLGMGYMDAELAYALANALPELSKEILFRGGAAYIAGVDPRKITVEDFVKLARRDPRVREGYQAMIEAVLKDIATLLVSVRKPREILLSGRFVRVDEFREDLTQSIKELLEDLGVKANIRTIRRSARIAKEAAEGAAIIANGVAGGKYRELIKVMELDKSTGTILDYIALDEDIKRRLFEYFTGLYTP